MASQVEICNLALAKLGHMPFIVNIGENSKAANLFSVFWEPVRDSLLREYLWKFARKREVLAPLVTEPEFDGGNYFQLPSDCLRVIGPGDTYKMSYGRWFVEQDKIVADTDTFNLVYIRKVTDTALFDPCFVQAMAAKLAYEIAMPLAQSQSLKDQMMQEYKTAVIKAAFVGATEQDSDKFLAETFIQVHY